ncbi:MAG: ribonuclease HII [Bacteroidales bacterium]|jgi:ribonuclease HII|nr:ribonuclease HII [Bacteroidales bacterium]
MSNKTPLKGYYKKCLEAGCDEAGRGCLAGPVVAAAVILPHDFENNILNDSKQLSEKKRKQLRIIIEKEAIAFAVAFIDNNTIDEINILKASIKAMHKALDKLNIDVEHIIVDGNKFFKYNKIPHQCIVKGDSKYLSIAAASVLAKTYRDEYMIKLSYDYPQYHWDKNKGYPTKLHKAALAKYDACKYHRLTYKLFDTQLKINFN